MATPKRLNNKLGMGHFNLNAMFFSFTCPICKKKVELPKYMDKKQYAYKLLKGTHMEYYCSWHCLRLAKIEKIKSKKKPTIEDITWLRYAGVGRRKKE